MELVHEVFLFHSREKYYFMHLLHKLLFWRFDYVLHILKLIFVLYIFGFSSFIFHFFVFLQVFAI
jgi:hypothetical protein